MFQHVTYGGLPFEVVEAEARAGGELGHVDNLDRKLLAGLSMNTSSDQGKRTFSWKLKANEDVILLSLKSHQLKKLWKLWKLNTSLDQGKLEQTFSWKFEISTCFNFCKNMSPLFNEKSLFLILLQNNLYFKQKTQVCLNVKDSAASVFKVQTWPERQKV